MQYIEPYNTYIFAAGKNLCGTKIKFAGCREIFWGLGKKKGGGARRKITVLTPLLAMEIEFESYFIFFESVCI